MLFNPAVVSYKELLMVLFDRMDPTHLNRQGNDRGTQYRSGVYYHSEEQKVGPAGVGHHPYDHVAEHCPGLHQGDSAQV